MRITDVLHNTTDFDVLLDECSQFIEEASGHMLFRALPDTHNDLSKVKVRKRKSGDVDQLFNEAFDELYPQLRQRSIFAFSDPQYLNEHDEPFFVFPIDGFKFMYNPKIPNSQNVHEGVFNTIIESVSHDEGVNMIADILKFTYEHDSLTEAIDCGAEVVIYNTPYYYAVRASDSSVDKLTTMGILSDS